LSDTGHSKERKTTTIAFLSLRSCRTNDLPAASWKVTLSIFLPSLAVEGLSWAAAGALPVVVWSPDHATTAATRAATMNRGYMAGLVDVGCTVPRSDKDDTSVGA